MLDRVFVRGLDAHGLARQFALLPDDRHAQPQFPGEAGGEEEPPGLDPGDDAGFFRPGPGGQFVNREIEGGGVLDDRGDVLKNDPRLGEIRNVDDIGFEVDGHARVLSGEKSRPRSPHLRIKPRRSQIGARHLPRSRPSSIIFTWVGSGMRRGGRPHPVERGDMSMFSARPKAVDYSLYLIADADFASGRTSCPSSKRRSGAA